MISPEISGWGRELSTKRFFWTDGLDSILRRSYRTAENRDELSRNLSQIEAMTGFPRFAIIARASALGIAKIRRRRWSDEELLHLRELAGTCGRRALAKRLGRSEYSVKAALKGLMLSSRVTEGYSRVDLVELMGVSPNSVRRWERLGWLVFGCYGRASETAIRKFLKLHPDQYQLSFVNEAWFKGLLFENYNCLPSTSERQKSRCKSFDNDFFSVPTYSGTDMDGSSGFGVSGRKEMIA